MMALDTPMGALAPRRRPAFESSVRALVGRLDGRLHLTTQVVLASTEDALGLDRGQARKGRDPDAVRARYLAMALAHHLVTVRRRGGRYGAGTVAWLSRNFCIDRSSVRRAIDRYGDVVTDALQEHRHD